MSSLQSMGFTAEQATLALQAANGDLNRAVALLLEQSGAEPLPKDKGKGKPPHAVAFHS